MLDNNFINKLFDDLVNEKSKILNELKTLYDKPTDESIKKERILNNQLSCIDSILKSIIKYKNMTAKDKLKADI